MSKHSPSHGQQRHSVAPHPSFGVDWSAFLYSFSRMALCFCSSVPNAELLFAAASDDVEADDAAEALADCCDVSISRFIRSMRSRGVSFRTKPWKIAWEKATMLDDGGAEGSHDGNQKAPWSYGIHNPQAHIARITSRAWKEPVAGNSS